MAVTRFYIERSIMESLVTVIVPVYNVEKYLIRCVNSITSQDYDDLEIILVNDGSTDQSGTICDELSQRDKRIRVIHKKNEGLGPARNSAIDIAKGEYLFFVDSDDYIIPGIIRVLIDRGAKKGADISCCGYKSGNKLYYCKNKRDVLYEKIEATKKMFENDGMDANAVCKLYKKKLFQNIRYPNCTYEVVPVTYQLFLLSDKIMHIPQCGYYIEKREGSITRAKFGPNNLLYLTMSKSVYEKLKSEYPQLTDSAYVFYMNAVISMAEKACINRKDNQKVFEYSIIVQEFRNILFDALLSKKITRRKKCIAILIKCNLYETVYKILEICQTE